MPIKFGARRSPIKKEARVGNDKIVKSHKAESPKSESRIVESKQQSGLNNSAKNTIASNEQNATAPGLLKAKEKGIRIITEFELVHKGMLAMTHY